MDSTIKVPTVQDWLWIEVMFIQALLGSISSNVSRVVISFDQKEWVLVATLERMNEEDKEEMEDAVDEFSILLEDIKEHITDIAYAKAKAMVLVSKDQSTPINNENMRIVFQRKEV